MKNLILATFSLFLWICDLKSQCLGNEITFLMNTNPAIQHKIKQTYKWKEDYPIHPLIDTAGVDLDLNIVLFRDSLASRNYSKPRVDSIINATRKAETVTGRPRFCEEHALFPSDTNYNSALNNFVLFVGECHSNIVICELRKCTGLYKGYKTQYSPVFLTVLFFYDRNNHVYDFILVSGKSSSPDTPIFED
jgi:hypothetical protein